jgi:hypothetical protein
MNDSKMMMRAQTPRIPRRGQLSGCPVHPSAEVMVEFRDGCIELDTASLFEWSSDAGWPESDIVAFWVVSSPNPDDIARYQPAETGVEPKSADDTITFPPDVSGEPCDGVLLVLDDGSEVFDPLPGLTTTRAVAIVTEQVAGGLWYHAAAAGISFPSGCVRRIHAVVDGKVVGRG